MALTECSVNTNVIQNLPDAPTLESGELKKKFDQSSTDLKKYLNEILTKEIDKLIEDEKEKIIKSIDEKILADNKKRYHIGKIILETENINPATYLNFGTWEYWGEGRVPVGVNINDVDFSTVEKMGGEKTHTLTIDEMPSHKPSITTWENTNEQTWGAGVTDSRAFTNIATDGDGTSQTANNFQGFNNVGGNREHNNMQPYITCYMWKRIS